MGDTAFVDAEEHQPTESQVGGFVFAIRREVDSVKQPVSVLVEDLGPEENPCGIIPLPVDLPVKMIQLSKESNTEVINEYLSDGIVSGEILALNVILDRSTNETPRDTNSCSIDDQA